MSISLSPLLPFPFPWSVVPTEPLDLPYLTSLCRVHTEEGNCLRRWPGASKRPSQAGGELPLPNGGFWALGCPLAGSFPQQVHITTSLLQIPALSPPFGERITYPLPSPFCPCCVCCVPFPTRGTHGYGRGGLAPLVKLGAAEDKNATYTTMCVVPRPFPGISDGPDTPNVLVLSLPLCLPLPLPLSLSQLLSYVPYQTLVMETSNTEAPQAAPLWLCSPPLSTHKCSSAASKYFFGSCTKHPYALCRQRKKVGLCMAKNGNTRCSCWHATIKPWLRL